MLRILLAMTLLSTVGCGLPSADKSAFDSEAIDLETKRLMDRESVQGLAIALIDEGQIAHVKTYGFRNAEQNLPLTDSTIMYGASFTKTAFSYMVLQLVEEGLLNLDDTLEELLPSPLPGYTMRSNDYSDLAEDDRWKALTPRILLSHSTGFANFRWLEDDRKLRFHHDPGTRYGYSGEGYYLMQLIVEQGLGLDTKREMQARIFDRFGMPNTSMQWRADFAENLADGYRIDGTMEPHDERSNVSAAGSMDTSIRDQAEMWAGMLRGDGLGDSLRSIFVAPQISIESAHQFPTLSTKTNPGHADVSLAAGLGMVTFHHDGLAWFKGGHNEWTGNFALCIEEKQRCMIAMSNDVRAERLYPELFDFVLGDTGMPWSWEYGWVNE